MRSVSITLGANSGPAERARVASLAATWGLGVVDREQLGPDDVAVVVGRDGLRLLRGGVYRRWHPGMLHTLREADSVHPWIRLSGLQRGDSVFDGTLGLGTDAAFLAEWTGRTVVACEVVPVLALLATEGLAGAGVDVRCVDSLDALRGMPDRSVDLVIADPMFPSAGADGASSLDLVRWVADSRPIDATWRDEALRVARRALVVKDRARGGLLEQLGAPVIHDKTRRAARYGAWPITGP